MNCELPDPKKRSKEKGKKRKKKKKDILMGIILSIFGISIIPGGIIIVINYKDCVYGHYYGIYNGIYIGVGLIISGITLGTLGIFVQFFLNNSKKPIRVKILTIMALLQGIFPFIGFYGPPQFFPLGFILLFQYISSIIAAYGIWNLKKWGGRLALFLGITSLVSLLFGPFSGIVFNEFFLAFFLFVNNLLLLWFLTTDKEIKIKDYSLLITPVKPFGIQILSIISLLEGIIPLYGSCATILLGFFKNNFSNYFIGITGMIFLVYSFLLFIVSSGIWNLKPYCRVLGTILGIFGTIGKIFGIFSVIIDTHLISEVIEEIYNSFLNLGFSRYFFSLEAFNLFTFLYYSILIIFDIIIIYFLLINKETKLFLALIKNIQGI
ncbi:MAG: hypothetical protein ACTSWY_05255 [Promethearchaeota archaeon]